MQIGKVEFCKEIVGMCVLEAHLVEGDLKLKTIKEGHTYAVELIPDGECCSTSWIESVNDLKDLKGAILFSFEHVSGHSESDAHSKIDYDFYKFRTSKGYVDVEMRNESNGYYSGWLDYHITQLS